MILLIVLDRPVLSRVQDAPRQLTAKKKYSVRGNGLPIVTIVSNYILALVRITTERHKHGKFSVSSSLRLTKDVLDMHFLKARGNPYKSRFFEVTFSGSL